MTQPALARYRPANALSCALAVLAGVLAMLALPALPCLTLAAAVAGALCIACVRFAPRLFFPAALSAAGFLWTGLQSRQVLEHRWPPQAAGERGMAIATIESIPTQDGYGRRFDASLMVERRGGPGPLRARMVWPDAGTEPRAGERWRVLVVLDPPRGRVNPFARDSERQLFRERVHALGRVVPSRLNVRLSSGHRRVAQLRERIARRIEAAIADRDAAALIVALAVGHTGGMSKEQWRVFNVTGTAHLVAISGLHVTLFAVAAIGLARIAWRTLARWARLPTRETWAAMLGLVAASGYSVLAGFSVPTQRTLIMLGAWFAARTVARHATLAMPIAAALIAVLAIDPFAPLSAGFWLSFLAMAAIVLATGTRVARGGKLAEALRVQGVVALALAPAALAWFGAVSLAGTVVNLIAIPVVSFVFVPLILLAVTCMPIASVSGALLSLAAGIYQSLWPWLAAAADVRHASLFVSPEIWWLACAAMLGLFLGLPWPPALRVACVAWLLPLAASGRDPPAGELALTMLDTGQNAAAVAQTARHVLVRGIGEGFGTDGRSVENALLPFLRAHAIDRIDVLILERANHRSMRGLNALLANIEVDRILVGRAAPDLANAADCLPGERWRWDAIELRVHTVDCVVQMSIGQTRVALLGNSTVIWSRNGAYPRADLALVSGSTEQGRRATAVAQGGPHDAMRVLATSSSGAIALRLGAKGIQEIDEWRLRSRRLWRTQARTEE